MKKLLLSIIIILSVFILASCNQESIDNTDDLPMDTDNIIFQESDEKQATAVDKDIMVSENEMDNSTEPRPTYTLKAIVKNVDDHHIEVEIIESDYAFGIYWVLTSNSTLYYNASGSKINRNGIKIGDTVNITYSGQTMLSYPPQIVAYAIRQAD